MGKHTPGPWSAYISKDVSGYNQWRIEAPSGRIAGLESEQGSDLAANARLIAAAPELLEACKELSRLWDAGIRPQIVQGALREEVEFAELCMVTVRAAIAKATA